MGKLILPYGCKLKLRNSDNVKMFLNNEQIYPTECKIIKGWDTTISFNLVYSSISAPGGIFRFGCLSDLVIFSCGESYQIIYANNGRNSGEVILKRNGLAETKQPAAINIGAIPENYVLTDDEVKVSASASQTYVNNGYYYVTYPLGQGCGLYGNLGSATANKYWLGSVAGASIAFTFHNLVPDKFAFRQYSHLSSSSSGIFQATIVIKAVNIDTKKEIVLMNKAVNIPNINLNPDPAEFLIPIDLIKE